ncbi:MAG: dihydropyrimidinase [Bacteroidota bacterium]
MRILIKNGTIINSDSTIVADVLIENSKIFKIEENLVANSSSDKVIDAKDCFVIPGGIDPHVHMHLPSLAGYSADDFLSGSKAALHGGTTTLIDFVTPKKGQSLNEAIEQRKDEALESRTNTYFHVSPIEWRISMEDEIKNCFDSGFKSFKVYMAYKSSIGFNDDVLFNVMKAVGKAGGTITVHCELGDDIEELRNKFAEEGKLTPEYHPLSRLPKFEAKAVKKAIELAKRASCPIYIVHVSTKESLIYIKQAQASGQAVIAETCPQYLLLDDSKYLGDFNQTAPYVMSPPLRKKADNNELWKAIADGTIKTIGTDHCPFTLKQKENGKNDFRSIPNGAGGVEHRLTLLYTYGVLTGKISINQFVALTSTNTAKIFGLYPAKGIIAVGSDADIVIWDKHKEKIISVKSHHSNCDINIYNGTKTVGLPKIVIKNGEIVVSNDNEIIA